MRVMGSAHKKDFLGVRWRQVEEALSLAPHFEFGAKRSAIDSSAIRLELRVKEECQETEWISISS